MNYDAQIERLDAERDRLRNLWMDEEYDEVRAQWYAKELERLTDELVAAVHARDACGN